MHHPAKLILLRHGESEWNKMNLFTGWVDIPLSLKGIQEALDAGKKISQIPIDVIFVSSLIRAQMSAMLAMSLHEGGKVPCVQHPHEELLQKWAVIYSDKAKEECVPVYIAWQLNERMYGRLQGLNKQETMDQFGKDQVKIWRRSFDVAPPEGESLEMTAKRSVPFFEEEILPYIQKGQNVLISAHGNSLRSIIMSMEGLSKEQVIELELKTGEPLIYSYENEKWKKK